MDVRALIPFLLTLQLITAASAEVTTLRIAGSTTVARALMPYRPGVEAAYNVQLLLIPVGSGRGLIELAGGRVEAAMVSGPLSIMLDSIHRSTTTRLTLDQLELLKLPASVKGEMIALLHPSNPLRQLDHRQVAGILCGEITNWKECGGEDRQISVIVPDELDGIRCALNENFLRHRPLASDALILPGVSDLPAAIARAPGAIGIATRAMPAADTVLAEITPKVDVPLYIVARRDALEANPKLEIVLNSLHSRAR